MLELQKTSKRFNPGTINEKIALKQLNLRFKEGDYVTLIGGNGSGKSTLLNCIAGVYSIDRGKILIDNEDVTRCPEHERAKVLGRVFQDPMLGTAPQMSIEENLALANRRGMRRGLAWGVTKKERIIFQEKLSTLGLGLEDRLSTKVGLLSGGQRQALTLLMATLKEPKLLLLDEHTAALDPKTASKVMELSDQIITNSGLTTLMVTHNMRDAIKHGNRLIMMHEGSVILDIEGEAKRNLTVQQLLSRFDRLSGASFFEDRALLA